MDDTARNQAGQRAERVAALADDLRTPVQAIRSSLDVLNRPATAEHELRRHLALIDRQVSRLGRLIDDLSMSAPSPSARVAEPIDDGRQRILVVDDNLDVAEALRDLLADRDRRVEAVTSGVDAVAACRHGLPDVVVLDLGMPGLDGYATARLLRALPDGHTMTIIALTGRGSPHERRRTAAAGFDHHLVKPVDGATLERAVGGRGATAGA